MTLRVDLDTTLEAFVLGLVETGRFGSESDVLREGLRQLEEREAKLTALDAELALGLADEAEGRVTPLGEAIDRLKERYALT